MPKPKKKAVPAAEGFDAVYARLRETMLKAAPKMTVNKDLPGALELRTPTIDPKTKQPGWFGTVTIKKTYVAYHLMSLYTQPALAADISVALSRRRQGKTCFNFARSDDALFQELAQLTRACVAQV
jgi:hypothetical protein